MTIKDWLDLGLNIGIYVVALVAAVYTKNQAKINKATRAGKVQDLLGSYAKKAVYLAEDAGLDSNDAKHQYAKELIVQALSWAGIKGVTVGMIDGAIKTAVSAKNLAYDTVGVDDPGLGYDVDDKDVLKPVDQPATPAAPESVKDVTADGK